MATKLYYQGHGRFRITTKDGAVLYVDPYAGDGYELPADLILISHQHEDHNAVGLVTQKPGCKVITNEEALAGGKYNTFTVGSITVEAVEAGNQNHNPAQCVGFILTVDGIKIYASCDTSRTEQMASFSSRGIDYAMLCCDGVYNMDLEEAAQCAALIGAKHNIPMHMKPGELFDRVRAEAFNAPNKLIVAAGEEITL